MMRQIYVTVKFFAAIFWNVSKL